MRPRILKLCTHVDSGRCIIYIRIRLLLLIRLFISSFFFLSNFQHWKFSSHFSRELWGLEDWKLVHTWTVGRCIMCTGIRLLHLFIPLFLHFTFFNFQHWNVSSHFSQELWGLEDWNLVHMWTVGRCIAYTGIRLLLLICLFISSFFFLSNYQPLKNFVTFFSGTVKSRRLKLGTHVDSGQMYRVYRNQAAAYSSLYFFIFFLSSYQTLKSFVTFFSGTVRPRRLKRGTHVDSGQMYRVSRNQAAAAAYLSLYFFVFLPNFQTLNFFVTFFSRTVRPRRLKLGTHVNSGQMYRVYRNQAAAYSSFSFFIFFLTNFQTLKFFITLLSGTVRPRRLKLGTHVDSRWMYSVYQNQAAAAYSSLYFFFSNIKTLKIFVTLFSGTVRHRLKLGAHMTIGWIYREYRNQAAAVYLSLLIFLSL